MWNATIRIPITAPAPRDTPNSPQKDADGGGSDEDEEEYGSDSDEVDENHISVEVLVQELHDSYASYGKARLSLFQLCNTTNTAGEAENDQAKRGWLQLSQDAGKVLYSAKFRRREAPRLAKVLHIPVEDPEHLNSGRPEPIVRSKDREGDTDMAEEFKQGEGAAADSEWPNHRGLGGDPSQQDPPNVAGLAQNPEEAASGPAGVLPHLAMDDLEDDDSLQNEVSGNMHPREGSIQELVDKYQHFVDNPFLNSSS